MEHFQKGSDQNIQFSLAHFSCGMYPNRDAFADAVTSLKTTVISLFK